MAVPSLLHKSEWDPLVSRLEDHYPVFSTLYSVAHPVFTERNCPTAQVMFNRAGNCIDFQINPQFWAKQSREQKAFVMSHEAMHVFLNHGTRIRDGSRENAMAQNAALDVVVNHLLVDKFGHMRAKIDPPGLLAPKGRLCWRDTVFKQPVKPNQNYEYYLTQFKEQRGGGGGSGKGVGGESGEGRSSQSGGEEGEQPQDGTPLNDHSGLKSFGGQKDEQTQKAFRDFLKRNVGKGALKELAGELEKAGGQLAGTEAGDLRKIIEEMDVKPKRKWETVIRDWSLRFRAESDVPQFVLTNRRYAMMPRGTTFLPTDAEAEGWEKNRVEVWFYMDTSGSCVGLAERFFAAALSLPKDRFNVRLFCFDTEVYDVDLKKRELSGFGGTSFACIENHVQRTVSAEHIAHPKQIWIVTDGCGDEVRPEKPDRWQWFLSWDYRQYIPQQSKTWMLDQFE